MVQVTKVHYEHWVSIPVMFCNNRFLCYVFIENNKISLQYGSGNLLLYARVWGQDFSLNLNSYFTRQGFLLYS